MNATNFVTSPPPLTSPLKGEGEGERVSQITAFMIMRKIEEPDYA
jgi:hypothetical protein